MQEALLDSVSIKARKIALGSMDEKGALFVGAAYEVDGIRYALIVESAKKELLFSQRLADGSAIDRDDRKLRKLGFEDGDAKTLMLRKEQKDVARTIESDEFGKGDLVINGDGILETELLDMVVYIINVSAKTIAIECSCDMEVDRCGVLFFVAGDGAQ